MFLVMSPKPEERAHTRTLFFSLSEGFNLAKLDLCFISARAPLGRSGGLRCVAGLGYSVVSVSEGSPYGLLLPSKSLPMVPWKVAGSWRTGRFSALRCLRRTSWLDPAAVSIQSKLVLCSRGLLYTMSPLFHHLTSK